MADDSTAAAGSTEKTDLLIAAKQQQQQQQVHAMLLQYNSAIASSRSNPPSRPLFHTAAYLPFHHARTHPPFGTWQLRLY